MNDLRLRRIWTGMKQRCGNANSPNYRFYGAKGIHVCSAWKNSFSQFVEWAMANGYADNLSIERKNNKRGYNPDNCKWIPLADQRLNQKTKQRSLRLNVWGRIPKTLEFEPPLYAKVERLIALDDKKPTLKHLLSVLVEAEHERRFGKAAAA